MKSSSDSEKETKKDGGWFQTTISNFNMIDPPLKDYFVKTLLSNLLLFLFLLIICIAFAAPNMFLISCIILLILTGMTLFRIQKCLEDSVSRVQGICEEVYIPSIRNKSLLKRDYLILRTEDDNFIKIFDVKHFKIKADNSIIVYFPKNSIRTLNDDTYQIYSYYWIYIARRESKKKMNFLKKGIGN